MGYQNIIVYYHICCINNWIQIVDQMMDRIRSSGLYNKVLEIRLSILGDYSAGKHLLEDGKIKLVFHSMDMNLRENCTIEKIYDDATATATATASIITQSGTGNIDYKILYIHSKGVGYNGQNPAVSDWTEYLTYFNIDKHEDCISGLDNGYDAVGVNLQDQPVLHYSGNFWWSHAQHIIQLGRLTDRSYNGPEFYLTKCRNAKFLGLWISHIDHYCNYYPREIYANKGVYLYEKIV